MTLEGPRLLELHPLQVGMTKGMFLNVQPAGMINDSNVVTSCPGS